ncbi:hypothetical protein AMTRI_Chr03g44720 [Amborella trichopoda]|nr:uncharacterized protein LOC18439853 isoform X1 [Amborella trichopoda]XP_020526460.1 uncharacterized protein LOC18439853 isoform X1 [Amborella trichopoda]|eukprot:XP_011625442.1 uncharacterized protein LOC18439853 isoform X1 [Amborella trichopoda]
MTSVEEKMLPHIALLGGGIFVRSQYIPRLKEISQTVVLRVIWSRSEESAKAAAELAHEFSPNVEYKWGDAGLNDIIQDSSIHGVLIVLTAQVQVDISLRMLRAGKHVLQEKPAASSLSEAENAMLFYHSLHANFPHRPIWAVAENYRFEPAFVESQRLAKEVGDMMSVQVIVESSMNSSNPYFSSSWRRNFAGGFILDMGVHFVAGLRMIVGYEVTSISAISRHVDTSLPPPDNVCAVFQLENGCGGVLVLSVSTRSPKISWRVVGSKGSVETERGIRNGQHGYTVTYSPAGEPPQCSFYPFCGVNEELKAFVQDISQANLKDGEAYEPDPRGTYLEGARDVALVEAMLESGLKNGELFHVKKL